MSQMPRRLLNYTLLHEIGRGGMATVWYAENSVGRKFAIKLLKPELVSEELSVAERFRNEAQIMVRLEHPAILRVEDFYEEGPTLAIIMEYLAGHDLNQHVQQRGAIPEAQAIAWFGHILDAFAYVHQKGYFHRDVKPSNLFLTEAGAVKVMDFGIAKIVGTDLSLTQTDMLMGSPLYMSPEQILSPKGVDFRTDIYSLGVTLHALLSGKKPYNDADRSMFSIQTDIVQEPLGWLANVSSTTNEAIQRATRKNSAARFATCDAFREALTAPARPTVTDEATIIRPASAAAGQPARPVVSTDTDTVLTRRPGAATPQPTPSPPRPAPAAVGRTNPVLATDDAYRNVPTAPKSRLPLLIAGVVLVVALGAGGWFWLNRASSTKADTNRQTQTGNPSSAMTAGPGQPGAVIPDPAPKPSRQVDAAIERGIAFYKQSRFDSSLALLTRYADQPGFAANAEAMTDLGIIYYYGAPKSHIPQNLAQAEKWLQKGVDAQQAKACYYLGLLKDGIDFVHRSKARGSSQPVVDLYRAGADRGDAYAKMTMGELFLQHNPYVRAEDPCTIKKYLLAAVAEHVPEAPVALAALKRQGACL